MACSRRSFIKQVAGMTGAGVLTGAGVTTAASAAEANGAEPWLPAKWDIETDVVVIGTGSIAGSALRAHEEGLDVVVLEIDKENRRLSLGHKQLEENPWNEFENQFSVDSIHEGTITEMTDKGAVVALGENVEGFCPARQLTKEDGTTPKVGDKLDFKVLEFSKATKRITLSHLRTYEEAKRAEVAAEKAEKRAAADATKSTVKKINASVEKTTLGDIAGLAALKSAMEAAEAKNAKKAAKEEKAEE